MKMRCLLIFALSCAAFVSAITEASAETQCADSLQSLEVNAGCFFPPGKYSPDRISVVSSKLEVKDGAEVLSKWLNVRPNGTVEVGPSGRVCIGEGCGLEIPEEDVYIEKIVPGFLSPFNSKLYTNQTVFEVFWKAAKPSAVFEVQYMENEAPRIWKNWVTTNMSSAAFGPSSPVAVRENMEYSFRVRTVSGAISGWSQTKSVTTDFTGPSCSIRKLTEYAGIWTNMSFSAIDGGSGAASVALEYSDDGTWKNAGSICTITINGASCRTPANASQISFRCTSTDYASNRGRLSDPVSFSVDRDFPSVEMEARDQDSRLLGKSEMADGILSINISSKAMDRTSGIMNHSIVVVITADGRVTVKRKECPAADPGTESRCSFSLNVPKGSEVKYRAEAIDNAGNSVATEWQYVYSNFITNFVAKDVFIPIGSYFENRVQVRNLGEQSATVNLWLKDYGLARFTASQAAAGIGSDGRSLTVSNLLPQEERSYTVEILASEVGSYHLTIEAVINQTGAQDSDSMEIGIDLPASFSALTGFYPILLIALAVIVYSRLRRYKKPL